MIPSTIIHNITQVNQSEAFVTIKQLKKKLQDEKFRCDDKELKIKELEAYIMNRKASETAHVVKPVIVDLKQNNSVSNDAAIPESCQQQ